MRSRSRTRLCGPRADRRFHPAPETLVDGLGGRFCPAPVHSHHFSLVPLQFVVRRSLGLPGSVADLSGLTPGHLVGGGGKAGRRDQDRPSRQVSRIGCSRLVTTHNTHRIARLPFFHAVAAPAPATVPQHRHLHCFLVAGDSRGPTCVTNHSWSPPLDRRAIITGSFTSTTSAAAPAGSALHIDRYLPHLRSTGCRHSARHHVAASTAAGHHAAHDSFEVVPRS